MELTILLLILNMLACAAAAGPNLNPIQETRAAPLSPVLAKIIRQTKSNSFYGYTDMLGTYSRGRVAGASHLCPKEFSMTQVMAPQLSRTFSYRIPHDKTSAEGVPCATGPGPFTAEYSFLENAIYIPGDLLQTLRSYQITRELSAKFENDNLIRDGSRCYFGFDANPRVCGKYNFPPGTLIMFFASKSVIKLSSLGYMNAGKKHMIIVARNGTRALATCAYNAPHGYYNNRAIPTQFFNPSASPSPTPTPSPTSSNTPSPSVSPSMTPTPSRSSTPSPSKSSSPSPSVSTSATPSNTPSASPSPSRTPSMTASPSPSASRSPRPSSTPSPGSSRSPTPSPSSDADVVVDLLSPRLPDNKKGNSSIVESNTPSDPGNGNITVSPSPSAVSTSVAVQNSSPTPANVRASASSCFEASSYVELRNGLKISMEALKIGDEVRIGRNQYSPVFMFTHRVPHERFRFLSFYLENGDIVKMTEGHLTYANGKLTPARELGVGQKLENAAGNRIRIARIRTSDGIGLYNPQTAHGDIFVDGYLHSTFTETISPKIAHPALLVFRFLSTFTGASIKTFDRGVDILPRCLQSALTKERSVHRVACMAGLCSTTQFGSLVAE